MNELGGVECLFILCRSETASEKSQSIIVIIPRMERMERMRVLSSYGTAYENVLLHGASPTPGSDFLGSGNATKGQLRSRADSRAGFAER